MKNETKKRYEIRTIDQGTIEKIRKLSQLMKLTNGEALKIIVEEYYQRHKTKLLKKFLE